MVTETSECVRNVAGKTVIYIPSLPASWNALPDMFTAMLGAFDNRGGGGGDTAPGRITLWTLVQVQTLVHAPEEGRGGDMNTKLLSKPYNLFLHVSSQRLYITFHDKFHFL